MENKASRVLRSNSLSKGPATYSTTINNLKEWKILGEQLTSEQSQALDVFEEYSNRLLDQAKDDRDFQSKYVELTTLANLTHFKEFLKEKYRSF